MSAARTRRFDPTTVLVTAMAVALVAAYALVVYLSREVYVEAAPPASTFSSAPEGLKTAFTYLEELGARPQRMQAFDELPGEGTLVIATAGPLERPPSEEETGLLAEWVRSGGRLVLVGPDARDMLVGLDLSVERGSGRETTISPVLPTAYAQGVREVRTGETRLLTEDSAWVTTMKDLGGQVLVSRAVGEGELVWLADLATVGNERIGLADDGALAVRLFAGAGGPVHFDEYHHGYVKGGGAWDELGAGGRTALLTLLLAAGMLVWSRSQRLGPPVEVSEVPAARTLAYIGSLAELYRKAGARGHALESLEDGLVRALARRHGSAAAGAARHPAASEALERSRALRGRGRMDVREFVGAASALRRARMEVEGRR